MSNLTLNSTANLTKSPRLRRKGLAVLLLATGAAVVFLPARRANAFLFDIVLDPIALVENVLKVVDLGEQIDAVVQEVEDQVKQLEHLNLSSVPNIAGIIALSRTDWRANGRGIWNVRATPRRARKCPGVSERSLPSRITWPESAL